MVNHAKAAHIDFRPLFPVAKQGDDVLADYLDMQNLLILYPTLKVAKSLKRAMGRDSTDELIALCENEASDNVRNSDDFVQTVAGAVFRYIVLQTIMANGVRQAITPTPEIEAKEQELLVSFKPLLIKYTEGRNTAALTRLLFAAQQVASTLSFPKDWLLRSFKLLLAEQLITPDVLTAWKNDTQHETATKSTALNEVDAWLSSL
ncbi:hypothetical protein BDF19DRAFT_6237 [Syncephalis fuscata]|nr:hypothetical protein BDF19DRAFT_6237 [Syncephalis fuscata]